MITKDHLIDSLQHEVNVLKHLYTKVNESNAHYRPTEKQRDTTELLQYLMAIGVVITKTLLSGDWEKARKTSAESTNLNIDEFCDAMDKQMDELRNIINGFSDVDFVNKEVTTPLGTKAPLGLGLLNFPLKIYAAYRMQLFLYLKQTGNSELSTFNCWAGMDKPA